MAVRALAAAVTAAGACWLVAPQAQSAEVPGSMTISVVDQGGGSVAGATVSVRADDNRDGRFTANEEIAVVTSGTSPTSVSLPYGRYGLAVLGTPADLAVSGPATAGPVSVDDRAPQVVTFTLVPGTGTPTPREAPGAAVTTCGDQAGPLSASGAGRAGSSVRLSGTGFAPGTVVQAYLCSGPLRLGDARAGANGAAALTVTLPSTLRSGNERLVLVGENGSGQTVQLAATLAVTAAPNGGIPAPVTPSPAGGILPETGFRLPSPTLLTALATIAAGAGTLALGRLGRRRRRAAVLAVGLLGGALTVTTLPTERADARAATTFPDTYWPLWLRSSWGGAQWGASTPAAVAVAQATRKPATSPVAGDAVVLSTGDLGELSWSGLPALELSSVLPSKSPQGLDMTRVRIPVIPPAWATCVSIRFQMLTEEYPEWGASPFRDVVAIQHNVDQNDVPVVNPDGSVTVNNAVFTAGGGAYTAASAPLRTATNGNFDGVGPYTAVFRAVTGGQWTNFTLTVMDVGDNLYDTALLVDDFVWMPTPCPNGGAPVVLDDTDGDGLPDRWETSGADVDLDGTVDVPLHQMGANPNRKDLFYEVDWLSNVGALPNQYAYSPDDGRMQLIRNAFANAPVSNPDGTTGITAHLDLGSGSQMAPDGRTWGGMARGGQAIAPPNASGMEALFNAVRTNPSAFDPKRAAVFRYVLMVPPQGGSSHPAIAFGSGIIVQEHNYGALYSAFLLFHEMGHTLGLMHGGADSNPWKPNYVSAVSYRYAYVVERNGANLPDFSRAELAPLDEAKLDERVGVQPSQAVAGLRITWHCPNGSLRETTDARTVDWNCNGVIDAGPVAVDIDRSGQLGVLKGSDDWKALDYTQGLVGDILDLPV
jgi:hypothetical protein